VGTVQSDSQTSTSIPSLQLAELSRSAYPIVESAEIREHTSSWQSSSSQFDRGVVIVDNVDGSVDGSAVISCVGDVVIDCSVDENIVTVDSTVVGADVEFVVAGAKGGPAALSN